MEEKFMKYSLAAMIVLFLGSGVLALVTNGLQGNNIAFVNLAVILMLLGVLAVDLARK